MADIEYTISGDASDLVGSLKDAADSASESMDKITESAQEAGAALDKDLGGGAENAKAQMHEVGEEAKDVGQTLDELKEKLSTIYEASGAAILYETFERVGDSLKEAGEKAEGLLSLAKQLGLSTDQTQALKEQSIELSVSQMALTRTLSRLAVDFDEAYSRSGTAAIDKLLKLGITTDMVVDKQKPMAEIIKIIHDRLVDEATSEEEAAALREQFGFKTAKVTELLEKFGGTQEEIAAANARIGSATKEQLEAADHLATNINIMTAAAGNWVIKSAAFVDSLSKSEVAEWALLGPLSWMITKYHESADAAEKHARSQVASGKIVREAVSDEATQAVADMQKELVADERTLQELKGSSLTKVELARKVVAETEAVYKGGAPAQSAAIAKAYEEAGKIVQEYTQKVFNENKLIADSTAESQEKVTVARLESAKKILDVQLAQKQIEPSQYAEAEIYLSEQVRDAEIKLYTAKKNALVDDGQNNAQNAAARKTLEEQITIAAITASNRIMEIHHKETEELNKDALAQSAIRMQGVKQAEDIAIQQAKAQQKAAATQGSEATDSSGVVRYAQMQIAAIAAVLVAQQDADAKEAAENQKLLNDKTIDADEYAKRMAALTTKEVTEVAAASSQIEQINDATAKKVGAQWKQAMSPIASNFTSMFDGMLKGTETFRSGMIKIADSILSEWEKSMITVPLEQWAARMGKEVALKQASEDAKNVIGKEGQAQGLLESVASAIKERANNASLAATSMWAQAPNPIIGGIEAAAAFAAVMAFPVSSAKGGMMVDEDQMAMVHENEMILPSDIRKGIEQKILNNNTSNENSSTNHFSVSALDSHSFEKYLSSAKNRNVIANAVNTARMRGNQNVRRP